MPSLTQRLRSVKLDQRPGLVAGIVVSCSAVGFLAVGWLSSITVLVINWSRFREDEAVLFLGSFAQLVLAAAVWYQIRAAVAQLVQAEQRAAEDRAAHEADLVRLSGERQADLDRVAREREAEAARARRERAADALLEVVASASNASARYIQMLRTLRFVISSERDSGAIERARLELAEVEQLRQAAHAARLRVRVVCGGGPASDSAEALVKLVDRQRAAADAVIRWGLNPRAEGRPHPEPGRIVIINEAERDRCLALASQLMSEG